MSRRDKELLRLERQLKQAVRDAVNRPSRKPFSWGGLAGYRQLMAIAEALRQLVDDTPESAFLRQILSQIERGLARHRQLAHDLDGAHKWLRRIAAVLHYPPPSTVEKAQHLCSQRVAAAMTQLLAEFQPDGWRQPAQSALRGALLRTWRESGSDLLHCYDIPTLPPDNLALEALFSRLRRHQRRISGRKSTRELRALGHYQLFFQAHSQQELLQQLRTVPRSRYRLHLRRLHQDNESDRFLRRLHADPHHTMQQLTQQYTTHRKWLLQQNKTPTATLVHTS